MKSSRKDEDREGKGELCRELDIGKKGEMAYLSTLAVEELLGDVERVFKWSIDLNNGSHSDISLMSNQPNKEQRV